MKCVELVALNVWKTGVSTAETFLSCEHLENRQRGLPVKLVRQCSPWFAPKPQQHESFCTCHIGSFMSLYD